jgi:hypothetical protein
MLIDFGIWNKLNVVKVISALAKEPRVRIRDNGSSE